jgi:hypothetical protein
MTANIIEFKRATAHRVSSARTERAEPCTAQVDDDDTPETLSLTCKNSRLRKKRKDAWRAADAVTGYWQARLNLNDAIERVQRHDAPVGRDHPAVTPDHHWPLVTSFRKALVEQLLTPAPTLAEVSWKKATLAGGQHRYVDYADVRSALAGGQHTKAEQLGRLIERAIEDDEAFLAGHPTRRPKRKAEAEA